MAALDLAEAMDDIAGAAPDGWHGYAWPADGVVVPAMVVGYPDEIDIAVTFGRGADHCIFPVFFVVGKVIEKAARDRLSAVLSGSDDMVAGFANITTQLSVVPRARVEVTTIGGVDYLTARFDVEVWS